MHAKLQAQCAANSSPHSIHGSLEADVHQLAQFQPHCPQPLKRAMLSKVAADLCTRKTLTLMECRRQGERAEQLRLGVTARGAAGGWDQDDREAGGGGGH